MREKGTLTHVDDVALEEELMQDDPPSASPEREKGKEREKKKRTRRKEKEKNGKKTVGIRK